MAYEYYDCHSSKVVDKYMAKICTQLTYGLNSIMREEEGRRKERTALNGCCSASLPVL